MTRTIGHISKNIQRLNDTDGNGDFARGDGAGVGIDKQVTLQSEATLSTIIVRLNNIRADTTAAHERSQS
jgi:hypothetical protein